MKFKRSLKMQRERLTITLKKDLLSQVDRKIDGVRIRNRSHAIEYLLTKSLGSKIDRAFILAGGHGIKLRPFTFEMPKSMIPIHDRPLLEHTVELLRNYNIRDLYIGIDYLGDKIKNHFGYGEKFGVKICYIEAKKPLGTAGALLDAKKFLSDSTFLVIHGDVLAKIDLADMIDFSEEEKGIVTMALTSVEDPSEFGAVRLSGSKIVEFSEKPKTVARTSRLINSGIYIMTPNIFSYISNKKNQSSLEKDVFPQIIKEGKMIGYHFAGEWFDISTPKTYERALKEWKK